MSIEQFHHEELSPDMMAQQEKKKNGIVDIPVDGRDVWNPDEPNKESDNKDDDEIEKNSNKQKPASPENLRERMRREYGRVELAVKNNPDWPPAKWNPEAEQQIAWDLEKWLNSVV